MKPLNLNRPVQLIDGRPVTIVSTEGRAGYPIIGYIGGGTQLYLWTKEGKNALPLDSGLTLVNVPEKLEVWVNIYPNKAYYVYADRETADRHGSKDRIGRIKVELVEGQFDE